jgi:hypothetical protein
LARLVIADTLTALALYLGVIALAATALTNLL